MPRASRGFQGLLTAAPVPLPDDEPQAPAEPPGVNGRTGPAAAAAEPASQARAVVAAATVPAGGPGGQAAARPEPARPVTESGAPVPSSASPAVEGRVATTIRLRLPAAAALNSAWLQQRMHVNPKLSYPEFASEIVRLGLAAFERQVKGS